MGPCLTHAASFLSLHMVCAGSFSINNLGPRIVARNFDPGFITEHFLKDLGTSPQTYTHMYTHFVEHGHVLPLRVHAILCQHTMSTCLECKPLLTPSLVSVSGIALEESRRMNLSMPGLALANQLYLALKAQGHGKLGTHALMLALEQLNGIRHGDK